MTEVFAVVAAILLLLLFKVRNYVNPCHEHCARKLPPGPWEFPILGYMPYFAINPLRRLEYLSSSYGEICTFHLGGSSVVLLSSFNAIKDAFKEENFSGRPSLKMLEVRNRGPHLGLVCSEGKTWQEQRKFTLKQLRELGFGKKSMEGLLAQEVEELKNWLSENIGFPMDIKSRLNLAVLNALWSIICGKRHSHDDTRLANILKMTSADLAETQYTGPLMFLPWLIKIVPQLTRWNEFVQSINAVHIFLQETILHHKQDFLSGETKTKDFIDLYLAEIEAITDPSSSFYKEKGDHSLLVVLLDLFMAGADTTSATLYWSFLYMILHEDIQANVQKEIDEVIGQSTPSLEHRKLMPYTEATLMEIMRKSSLVPMGLFHRTICDTRLHGYHIPENTVVIANLYALNYDKRQWGDPETFRPTRFLDKAGNILKIDNFIPFSIGKRVCPGIDLAKDQHFLFFVGLLQEFNFKTNHNGGEATEEPNHGIISSSKPYSVIVNRRKSTLFA